MRPQNPSKYLMLMAPLALLAGCDKASDSSASSPDAAASSAPDAETTSAAAAGSSATVTNHAPGVDARAAANVAFAYHYAFNLAASAISDVQQQHVAACQKLGPEHCEVASFTLRQDSEDSASGEAVFRIDRDLAHDFANTAIAIVHKADGQLDKAAVDGTSTGESISDQTRSRAADQARLDQLNRTIATEQDGGARARDIAEARQLRVQLAGTDSSLKATRAAVAKTPLDFTYNTEGALTVGKEPFAKAASASWGSARAVLSLLAMIAGLALPWLLLIGVPTFSVWQWLNARRRRQLSAPGAAPIE